jgi:hypothetical protein
MVNGSSDTVRAVAIEKYLFPALHAGRTEFSVPVRDLHRELVARGFPPANVPQICSALQKRTFLRENGLEIESIEGPPSKRSTTVVFNYRMVKSASIKIANTNRPEQDITELSQEDPAARALRLTENLRGILKEELEQYGGGEAFLRWIRSEDEDAA